MPTDVSFSKPFSSRRTALVLAGLTFLVQLAVIGITYKHAIAFNCLQNWPSWACSGASGAMVSVYALTAVLLLFVLLKPAAIAELTEYAGNSILPLAVSLVGFLVTLIPIALLVEGSGTTYLWPVLALWTVGFGTMIAGLLLFIAPFSKWRGLFVSEGVALTGVALAGFFAPNIATLIRPLWQLETISSATFFAVAKTAEILGYPLSVNDPVKKWIGNEDFSIAIAPQCSGVEGIALVTVFVTVFLVLFRSELRFPRILWLYPVGIAVSMFLNFVRITALLIIGLEGNPELAIGGFHSHAGWMMFTLIALGVVLVARSVPALQKAPNPAVTSAENAATSAPLPPLSQDENAARILPFAIFMLSAIFAQAFSQSPGVVYPLRVVAMAAALVFFWPMLMRLTWRPSGTAVLAGVAIGLMWIIVPYTVDDTSPAHGGLAGAILIGWLIARGIGTMLLVPIIEELFFRDYLERKVSGATSPILRRLLASGDGQNSKIASNAGPMAAALITASLFALLHDRWIEAFVAGLVFSWVMAQRRHVTDAIAAHMAANAIVYAYALATMRMHII